MRLIRTAAVALVLVGVLAACTDAAGTDPGAGDVEQPASATPTPDCPAVAYHHDVLTPGCWAIEARGLSGSALAELELPAGFSGNDAWVWVPAGREDRWGAITLVPVGDVYPDPCTRAGAPPKVGPSVAAFVRALAAQKTTTTTRPVPASLDGHDGLYLELSVPADLDVSTCRAEELILWTGPEAPGADPGQVNRYWVLDVDGQPVVLAVYTRADATEATVERLTDIAELADFANG